MTQGHPPHPSSEPASRAAPPSAADDVLGAETILRVTGGDLRRRAALEKMHGRLLILSAGFGVLFGAVGLKLAAATLIVPMHPAPRQVAPQVPQIPKMHTGSGAMLADDIELPSTHRASIVDRNGQILAISLPLAAVYANPQEMIDPADTVAKLRTVLPKLDADETLRRLQSKKQFVYVVRDITPDQEVAINALGIPGIYFESSEKRHYPLGRTAAQVLGAVDIDDHGVAGVERFFDKRLTSSRDPLKLSLDVRVQGVVRDELQQAKDKFSAIGACAIVMDVRTGEVLAMVSLPDYDANLFNKATDDQRFDRAVTGMYEPGSTFKLQTAAMVLQDGIAHYWDRFSTLPIHVGRFTITDMKSDHFAPWLAMPEVLAVSSNPAAAHMALDAGAKRQQDWLRGMGFFDRVPIELPEAGRPIVPSVRNWGQSTVMTVGFGHGVAEPPLAIVRGTAATANGGILVRPTLLARVPQPPSDAAGAATASAVQPVSDVVGAAPRETAVGDAATDDVQPQGTRLISPEVSTILRKMLRLVVTKGIGKAADVPGYFVGGKTGTAEKVGPHGGYLKHVNVTAFTGIFPLNDPRYAVYVMLDSPQATKETHGWTTSGWNSAPTWSKIVARIAPMLGLFPDTATAAAVDDQLAIPLEPGIPSGVRALGPGNDPGDPGEGHIRNNRKDETHLARHPIDARLRQDTSWRTEAGHAAH